MEGRTRRRDKTPGTRGHQDNLPVCSKPVGLNRNRVQTPPARLACNKVHKSSGTDAAFQTAGRACRERTSEYLPLAGWIPDPDRKRIQAAKSRQARHRKDPHKHRVQSKPGLALLQPQALTAAAWTT